MFIKIPIIEFGTMVKLTKEKESCEGKFTIGSIVKIIGISNRGYDIEDEKGNKMRETGFDGIEII
jgi:hypothetical protein